MTGEAPAETADIMGAWVNRRRIAALAAAASLIITLNGFSVALAVGAGS